MTDAPVNIERRGDVAVLTIDHPPVNLWDDELASALSDALSNIEDETPRALLIRAEGRVVSGGVDVSQFKRAAQEGSAADLFDHLLTFTERLEALQCPTVFAAHALTLTWAFELALACDMIVAADDCSFGLVEARIGLTPTMGGTQRLAARAGDGRAREMVMLAELIPATVMHSWGVVNRLVEASEVAEAALDLATRLAEGPTRAHMATRAIVREQRDRGVGAADAVTVGIASDLFETEDLNSGVESFLTDGPGNATFEGR